MSIVYTEQSKSYKYCIKFQKKEEIIEHSKVWHGAIIFVLEE
jgi:hypothetical protein